MLTAIYRRARKLYKATPGEAKVDVAMSYYEIYNDKVFDLFEAPEKRTAAGLPLRDAGGKTVVVGLTERPCESLKEFERLYDHANVNRSTGATKLNAHSSRSHAMLCVKVSVTKGERTVVSTASAIDLAGSEDNRRTDNSKERLVESSCINRSLFVLAQCVEAISKNASRVPYRESKMTRILSLGQNNGITVMILNLAPFRNYHLDTLSSLNFANRTKKIEVREVENEPVFKGCARPVATMPSTQRQPLRMLTSASHNAHIRMPDADSKKPLPKTKAFAVYADQRSSTMPTLRLSGGKKLSPLKRTSDHLPVGSRPLKRPNAAYASHAQPPQQSSSLLQTSIEQLVEKKVNEVLAARGHDQHVPAPATEASDEVKRRLEALEQRIGGTDDARTEGLTYLLMAKQHQLRGEDLSALRMYELACASFPHNAKVEARIAKLRAKLDEKKTYQSLEGKAGVPLGTAALDLATCRADSPRPPSPRTSQLLHIINSRDVTSIRTLRGVGAKKAKGIVEALEVGADVLHVESLWELSQLPGVGALTVDNMRRGLGRAVVG